MAQYEHVKKDWLLCSICEPTRNAYLVDLLWGKSFHKILPRRPVLERLQGPQLTHILGVDCRTRPKVDIFELRPNAHPRTGAYGEGYGQGGIRTAGQHRRRQSCWRHRRAWPDPNNEKDQTRLLHKKREIDYRAARLAATPLGQAELQQQERLSRQLVLLLPQVGRLQVPHDPIYQSRQIENERKYVKMGKQRRDPFRAVLCSFLAVGDLPERGVGS